MRHEETRDNTTAIEAIMMAGDAEEILGGLGHSPEAADRMVNPAKILPVIVTVDELRRLSCDYPKPYNPQHVVDGVAVEEVDDDPEDDGQPSEYEEWQDYFGGDEYYDHSENACW